MSEASGGNGGDIRGENVHCELVKGIEQYMTEFLS